MLHSITILLFIFHLAIAQNGDNLNDYEDIIMTTANYNAGLNADNANAKPSTASTTTGDNIMVLENLNNATGNPADQADDSSDKPLYPNSNPNENGGANQCPDGWATRQDKDGNVYGYKVIMQDLARLLCIKEGGELVSIHSEEEEQFVVQLATPLLDKCQTDTSVCKQRVPIPSLDKMYRSMYIGLNRAAIEPYYEPTVVQAWSDGTPVDYASVPTPGVPTTIIPPWGAGCPSGLNDTGNTPQKGSPEDCVCMFKYDEVNWNDISCYHKLGGGICKLNCGTDGWSQSANGKGYKIFQLPSPGNYWQALAMCANNGAKVASYHSDQQKSAITNICQSSNCAWIGLHSATDGNKYWDDGSSYDYKNLLEVSLCQKKPKSPSCGGGNPPSGDNCPKDCTAVSSSGQTTDQSCESLCGAVICEKDCN
uniref:C-type lectin domain-containing protein n=1 Tax=Meloidogyne javanica TaxID=6303 RepID=A0A915M454_MELJA